MRNGILSIALVFAFSAPAFADAGAGEALFTKKCKGCHDFGKKKMGPDLAGISTRADRKWLTSWLTDTEGTWNADDPTTQALKARVGGGAKPKHKSPKLSDAEFGDIVDYLLTQ